GGSGVRRVPAAQPRLCGSGHDPAALRGHECGPRGAGHVVESEWQVVGGSADHRHGGRPYRGTGQPLLLLRHAPAQRHHDRRRLIHTMPRPELPVSLLLRTVPNLAELAVLRRALVAASSADARQTWSGSASYATYEQRVLSLGEMGAAIRASY